MTEERFNQIKKELATHKNISSEIGNELVAYVIKIKQDMNLIVSSAGKDLLRERDLIQQRLDKALNILDLVLETGCAKDSEMAHQLFEELKKIGKS